MVLSKPSAHGSPSVLHMTVMLPIWTSQFAKGRRGLANPTAHMEEAEGVTQEWHRHVGGITGRAKIKMNLCLLSCRSVFQPPAIFFTCWTYHNDVYWDLIYIYIKHQIPTRTDQTAGQEVRILSQSWLSAKSITMTHVFVSCEVHVHIPSLFEPF